MEAIDIQIVDYGSPLQQASVALRYKVLRAPLGLLYTEEQLAEEATEIHIVALQHGTVAGVLLLKRIDTAVLKMRQVAVDPALQQSGIGTRLVRFAEAYAVKEGYRTIELHARDAAKPFYLKLEYEVIGDRFTEVGIPHYKMKKIFAEGLALFLFFTQL